MFAVIIPRHRDQYITNSVFKYCNGQSHCVCRGCIGVDVLLLMYNSVLYFDNIYISDLIIDNIFDTKTGYSR